MSFDWDAFQGSLLVGELSSLKSTKPEEVIDELADCLRKLDTPGIKHGILETHDPKWAGEWFSRWREEARPFPWDLDLFYPPAKVTDLPQGSWTLDVTFTLKRPLLTKHDDIFYPTENPVRRDRAFGCPVFPGTSWKGTLRAACRLDGCSREEELFGSAKEDSEGDPDESAKGRLFFSSTLFSQAGFEVINPHSRRERKGTPIFYESVPAGAEGRFLLTWVGHDLSGCSAAEVAKLGALDFDAIAEPLHWVMTTGGFGAKTSSGFGIAEDGVNGKLTMHAFYSELPPPLPTPPRPALGEYLDKAGQFITKTPVEISAMRGKRRKGYEQALAHHQAWLDKCNQPAPLPVQKLVECPVRHWSELPAVSKSVSEKVKG